MKILLTALLTILCIGGYAQTQPFNLNEQLATAKTKTGDQLLITNGTTKLYASIKAGKVTNYFATGTKGVTIPVTVKKSASVCQVCVSIKRDGVESTVCYDVNCNDLVRPVTTKRQ